MFDFLADPFAPLILLIVLVSIWVGFWWGSRSAENRISDDIHCLGCFHIDGHTFKAQCMGFADPDDDPCSKDNDDGDPRTVDDLLNKKETRRVPFDDDSFNLLCWCSSAVPFCSIHGF
jgi:hypothetical protein